MYIFFPHKNHSIFYDNVTDTMCRSSIHNISSTINAIRKLGARIYQIDRNSFASITGLNVDEKIKFLESHRNS